MKKTILQETTERIEKIKQGIVENLDYLSPREVSDYTVQLSSLLDTLGALLAERERAYVEIWNIARKTVESNRQADMTARDSDVYQERREIEARIKGITELIYALKKRGSMLELEARNQQ